MASDSRTLIGPELQFLFEGEVSGPSLIADYYVSSSELGLRSAAFHIAAIISCGLGVHIDYLKESQEYFHNCCPKVIKVRPGPTMREGHIELKLPLDWMVGEKHLDVTKILNFIYGDFFEERQLTRVKLTDVVFSAEAIDYFKGPCWGTEKIRDALRTSRDHRPHIGVVPHPPIGMNAKKYAQQCFQLALAGADHIVDSDVAIDAPYCSIQDRVTLVTDAIEKSQKETEKAVMYSVNITSDVDKLLENADRAVEACGRKDTLALGICVANTGLSALSMLRKYVEQKRTPIHVHVTGLPLMTRDKTFGIDTRVFNTLVRLLGADIVHVPSLTGRYIFEEVTRAESATEAHQNNEVLNSEVYDSAFRKSSGENIRKVFSMVAGGINPANAEYHVRLFGNDTILMVGASLFRELPDPKGNLKTVQSIVRAICQVIEVIMNGENVVKVVADPDDKRRESKLKDLVSFWERHGDEFSLWDWRKQQPSLQELARFRPYIT